MAPQLHETRMGRILYEVTLPRIAEGLEKLTETLAAANQVPRDQSGQTDKGQAQLVVAIIKEGIIDEITSFTDPDEANELFTIICLDHLAKKEDIPSMLDDGYFMWANGSVCITWPEIKDGK